MRNRIEVSGYLASPPTRRILASGTSVANVRLGETYGFRDRDGKWQQQTNWHNLSFYGLLVDAALTFDKGDHLFVEGTLEQREFTPQDGSTRTVTEIIVRSCHLIAPPRTRVSPEVEESSTAEKEISNAWPVA